MQNINSINDTEDKKEYKIVCVDYDADRLVQEINEKIHDIAKDNKLLNPIN